MKICLVEAEFYSFLWYCGDGIMGSEDKCLMQSYSVSSESDQCEDMPG